MEYVAGADDSNYDYLLYVNTVFREATFVCKIPDLFYSTVLLLRLLFYLCSFNNLHSSINFVSSGKVCCILVLRLVSCC